MAKIDASRISPDALAELRAGRSVRLVKRGRTIATPRANWLCCAMRTVATTGPSTPLGRAAETRRAVLRQAAGIRRQGPARRHRLLKSSHVMIDKVMSLPLDRLDNRIGAVSGAQREAISASLRDWLDL